ncbi:hypothetical protein [Brevibacillus laterosporus]|nr:hypothetical protein [Brevibacillus laterosporus]MED1909521.1 hypothetical protein [Brevibacillus laterosporus]
MKEPDEILRSQELKEEWSERQLELKVQAKNILFIKIAEENTNNSEV